MIMIMKIITIIERFEEFPFQPCISPEVSLFVIQRDLTFLPVRECWKMIPGSLPSSNITFTIKTLRIDISCAHQYIHLPVIGRRESAFFPGEVGECEISYSWSQLLLSGQIRQEILLLDPHCQINESGNLLNNFLYLSLLFFIYF